LLATETSARMVAMSAVTAGVADLRKVVAEAKVHGRAGLRTVLFIDEIHRFNKAQQDAILPVVEDGTVTLIGATTENPSFEVISALLSRSRVYVLNALEDDEIGQVIQRALKDEERGLGKENITLQADAEEAMINLANGDARSALNMLEMSVESIPKDQPKVITLDLLKSVVQRRSVMFDKGGEMHYDLISALHKTVRGSDVDASLYWLARMLEGGEDPLYLARRLVRMASEDIGLADPFALP